NLDLNRNGIDSHEGEGVELGKHAGTAPGNDADHSGGKRVIPTSGKLYRTAASAAIVFRLGGKALSTRGRLPAPPDAVSFPFCSGPSGFPLRPSGRGPGSRGRRNSRRPWE